VYDAHIGSIQFGRGDTGKSSIKYHMKLLSEATRDGMGNEGDFIDTPNLSALVVPFSSRSWVVLQLLAYDISGIKRLKHDVVVASYQLMLYRVIAFEMAKRFFGDCGGPAGHGTLYDIYSSFSNTISPMATYPHKVRLYSY
jgi:hypothetical protein